jgi:hypothetical protein
VSRLRGASKAPLAVAGILAAPLFFVGLMAFSLKLDKPSKSLSASGKIVLGDPTKATVGTIYLAAFAVAGGLVVVGVLAMPLRSRLAPIAPAVAAIVAAVLLILPLGTWAAGHTERFPLGVDNISDGTVKKPNPQNLILRGEWEANAKTTAREIGFVTIGLGLAAIVVTVLLEIRRRRQGDRPLPVEPPPIELGAGGAPGITGP